LVKTTRTVQVPVTPTLVAKVPFALSDWVYTWVPFLSRMVTTAVPAVIVVD
jgi:hypothetical protein